MTLLLATPVRAAELDTAQVSLGYSNFRVALSQRGISKHAFTFALDVVRARNRLVGIVLRDFPDVTNVLWVDDDTWPDDVSIVDRMIATGGDIVAVPYTNKQKPLRWTHREEGGQVVGVGFGFTMTSVSLLSSLAARADTYEDSTGTVPNLFGQLMAHIPNPDGVYVRTLLSEDYSFCKRALDIGFKITMVDGLIHHAGGHAWNVRDAQNVPHPSPTPDRGPAR